MGGYLLSPRFVPAYWWIGARLKTTKYYPWVLFRDRLPRRVVHVLELVQSTLGRVLFNGRVRQCEQPASVVLRLRARGRCESHRCKSIGVGRGQAWRRSPRWGDDRHAHPIESVHVSGHVSQTEILKEHESPKIVGHVKIWAGSVPRTDANPQITTKELGNADTKRSAQLSPWGHYGPHDMHSVRSFRRAMMISNGRTETTSSTSQAKWHVHRAKKKPSWRRMKERMRWQSLPLLGGTEQPTHVRNMRRKALSAASTAAPEHGLGGTDVCVVSTATGALYNGSVPDSPGAHLLRNKLEFCRACGYRCPCLQLVCTRHGVMQRTSSSRSTTSSCSIVLHADADVVFRRPSSCSHWLHVAFRHQDTSD